MCEENENRIKELEKQVKDLEFVRGLCDKFGSYKSLKKDAEMIYYFVKKEKHLARWIEIMRAFKQRGWAKSTIENHLHNLSKRYILVKGDLPGEYKLNLDISADMDELAKWVLGDIYEMAKRNWEKKGYY